MAIDFALGKDGDLAYSVTEASRGIADVGRTVAGETIRQRLYVRLCTFKGTWFTDPEFGVPYYQSILGKSFNPVILNAVFLKAITGTPGVARLKEPIQYDWDNSKRVLHLRFTVIAETGEEIKIEKGLQT